MQKPTLSTKDKTNVLLILAAAILLISVPIGFEKIDSSERGYYAIHVVSLIFGSFLSVLGFLTYREFKSTRLLMVFCAFVAITIAESTSWVNLFYPFFENTYGIHGYVTHSLILVMLSFFIIGVFRSD
ncbi:hypothetical protein [Nitrosopumilus adriaticus]|uniref:Uncharacterized protein n=1 Tax=Nitrosopumilus adriaticus TaxID=1580092 RepID=A0A0D5C029_9ARCH|nr:hypothetical protein [Nitrosopumilus adriaticus]AJW69903.1 conserved membrane protein of unknown function [Nitrosopumilus adriaticus]